MKNRQLSLSDIQKDYISKEEFYQIAHICKETALWLIETGRVSAEKPKRKGFGYKIAKEEVERYLADRQQNPLYYLKGKRHNCIPYTPPQPYSSELGGAIRLAVEQEMSSLPDLLTEKQVCAILGYHLRGRLKGGKTMLLSNQQKYILEILKEFKYLRVRQLHALVQAHYRTQGIKIDERRMEIMLRQMRTGTNYVWLRGDVVSYGDRRIDPRLLEALDVMLELTKAQPGFYSKDGLHEPFLLRFTGNGKGAGYLFSVAWLDAATHIATVPRMKGERIIWISESGSFGEIDLPRHHFFAARQKDGTHRFFGSNEPEKI